MQKNGIRFRSDSVSYSLWLLHRIHKRALDFVEDDDAEEEEDGHEGEGVAKCVKGQVPDTLPLWRIWVVAKATTGTNATVHVVYVQLNSVFPSYFPPKIYCGSFCSKDPTGS